MESSTFDKTSQEIKKAREQVVFIYGRSQKAVESDRILIDSILRTFYGCHDNMFYDKVIDKLMANRISFETLTRVGRKLRELYPERFKRSEEVKEKTAEREATFKSEMLSGSKLVDF